MKLHVKEDFKPLAQLHRSVQKQLEELLKRDEELNVIEKIEGPTRLVSSMVVAPKKTPGHVCECADMYQANQAIAIEQECRITPTICEIISNLNGAKVFKKFDLNQGYDQLELHPDSRYITTFLTHDGLSQLKRINFAISSAAEVFQNAIREALSGINGARNLSNNIIIFSADDDQHYDNLRVTLQRLYEKSLTFNKDRCITNKPVLEFLGHSSHNGISADPKKIQAIVDLETSHNAAQVRSLLGMTNFCGQFIANYATFTHLLRELFSKDMPWSWSQEHGRVLMKLREFLVSFATTAYFGPD